MHGILTPGPPRKSQRGSFWMGSKPMMVIENRKLRENICFMVIAIFFFTDLMSTSPGSPSTGNGGKRPFHYDRLGFTGGSDGKESACSARDPSLIPGLGRYPGEGNGNPLQYFCLGNSMHRGAWQSMRLQRQSTGSQRVGHDWVTNTFIFTKTDHASEVSRAISNWFLSFQKQKKLKPKNRDWCLSVGLTKAEPSSAGHMTPSSLETVSWPTSQEKHKKNLSPLNPLTILWVSSDSAKSDQIEILSSHDQKIFSMRTCLRTLNLNCWNSLYLLPLSPGFLKRRTHF